MMAAFVSMNLRIVLRENNLTHKRIHSHTSEQNGMIERANKAVRESISSAVITGLSEAEREISKTVL
jgi:hypothetical protein